MVHWIDKIKIIQDKTIFSQHDTFQYILIFFLLCINHTQFLHTNSKSLTYASSPLLSLSLSSQHWCWLPAWTKRRLSGVCWEHVVFLTGRLYCPRGHLSTVLPAIRYGHCAARSATLFNGSTPRIISCEGWICCSIALKKEMTPNGDWVGRQWLLFCVYVLRMNAWYEMWQW